MPKNKLDGLAEKADLYYTTREERLARQKEVDEIEKREKELRQELIDTLVEAKTASGVSGLHVRVTLVEKTVPQVEDWAALQAHIKDSGDFDLLQRRVNDAAVRERWKAHVAVPGVGTFMKTDLSVNKL